MEIYIDNAIGKLFIFQDVDFGDYDFEEWFEANSIDKIVQNNVNSCSWGQIDRTKCVTTPQEGWKVLKEEETDDEETETDDED